MNQEQIDVIAGGDGFIAALDQSGGSTPGALAAYGVAETEYSNDAEMLGRIHEMRARIVTSDCFSGDRIMGAILFEDTMNREIDGRGTAEYLWEVKRIVPFLKVDKGLADEANGVQMMKPIPGLDALLARGRSKGIFGTKMRSVIKLADERGIGEIVDQQFEIGRRILAADLMPILEPEVSIGSPQKEQAEELLHAQIVDHLAELPAGARVMLKLSLPTVDDFYHDLATHPKVLKLVALSGGYSRDEANAILERNTGVVASFSRALLEGLTAQQSDGEFEAVLDATIAAIHAASVT